jgi:hypothetical protein
LFVVAISISALAGKTDDGCKIYFHWHDVRACVFVCVCEGVKCSSQRRNLNGTSCSNSILYWIRSTTCGMSVILYVSGVDITPFPRFPLHSFYFFSFNNGGEVPNRSWELLKAKPALDFPFSPPDVMVSHTEGKKGNNFHCLSPYPEQWNWFSEVMKM